MKDIFCHTSCRKNYSWGVAPHLSHMVKNGRVWNSPSQFRDEETGPRMLSDTGEAVRVSTLTTLLNAFSSTTLSFTTLMAGRRLFLTKKPRPPNVSCSNWETLGSAHGWLLFSGRLSAASQVWSARTFPHLKSCSKSRRVGHVPERVLLGSFPTPGHSTLHGHLYWGWAAQNVVTVLTEMTSQGNLSKWWLWGGGDTKKVWKASWE